MSFPFFHIFFPPSLPLLYQHISFVTPIKSFSNFPLKRCKVTLSGVSDTRKETVSCTNQSQNSTSCVETQTRRSFSFSFPTKTHCSDTNGRSFFESWDPYIMKSERVNYPVKLLNFILSIMNSYLFVLIVSIGFAESSSPKSSTSCSLMTSCAVEKCLDRGLLFDRFDIKNILLQEW